MPLFFHRSNFFLGPGENHRIDRFDLGFVHLALNDIVDPEKIEFRIEGSCDGILVLSSPNALYACNPFTRQCAHLDRWHPVFWVDGIVAFYSHGPPGAGREYRLLYQTKEGPRYSVQCSYWIYVLGEVGEGRKIGRPMSPWMQPELETLLMAGLPAAYVRPPIIFQGCLHWPPKFMWQPIESNMIVVFDTETEQFRWINPPLVDADNNLIQDWAGINLFQLLEIQGQLGLAMVNTNEWLDGPDAELGIWLLTDYGNENWELGYRIGLMPFSVIDDHEYDMVRDPPLYLVSHDVLHLLVPCPYTLLQYDAHWAQLQSYGRPRNWIVGIGHQLEESFMLHGFLNGQEDNVNPPPFFHFHEP